MRARAIFVGISCAALFGCATGTNGVVPAGDGIYMVGGLGGMTDYSGSVVKARFFAEASKFCAGKGLAMQPINSTAQDAASYTYASAEVQFRCVKKAGGEK